MIQLGNQVHVAGGKFLHIIRGNILVYVGKWPGIQYCFNLSYECLEFVIRYVRLTYSTDLFKQHFIDLIKNAALPSPPPGGLLQIKHPLNMEFSEVLLHSGLVEHTLNDLTYLQT